MSSFTVVRSSGVGDILGKTRNLLIVCCSQFRCQREGTAISDWGSGRGSCHQRDEHAVELFGVEINLNFHRLADGPGNCLWSPEVSVLP